jgi:hypothetical protein
MSRVSWVSGAYGLLFFFRVLAHDVVAYTVQHAPRVQDRPLRLRRVLLLQLLLLQQVLEPVAPSASG